MVITAEVYNFHSDITSQPWTYLDPWNQMHWRRSFAAQLNG
jgi:hypothetical protein